MTEWTPTELLATRNVEVITNHPDYGYGTQAGMFSVIGASFHWLFDSFVPDFRSLAMDKYVKSVLNIHVGGTRCVTSSTDKIMKIRARITLTVEFIRTCIFLFLFYV